MILEKSLIAIRILCAIVPSQNCKGSKGAKVASHEVEEYLLRGFKVIYYLDWNRINNFLVFFQIGTPLSEIRDKITSKNTQPCITYYHSSANHLKIEQMFIKLDHQCIPVPGKNIINCIDILYKVHWVFNTCYATPLCNIMYFFELIFKMNKDVKPLVNEFFKIINTLTI